MKCQYCNAEMQNDDVFCPECGKRQEEKKEQSKKNTYCANCGSELEDGVLFCPACGAKIGEVTANADTESDMKAEAREQQSDVKAEAREQQPDVKAETRGQQSYVAPATPVQKPKGKGHIVILVFLLIAVVIVAALVLVGRALFFGGFEKKTEVTEIKQVEEFLEPEEQIDLSEVDYNLLENEELSLDGFVKNVKTGESVLHWDGGLTFYGVNQYDEMILLEDAENVYIDDELLPEDFIAQIGEENRNKRVIMEGLLYFDDESLYIMPEEVYGAGGEDLVASYLESKAKKAEEEKFANADYILPQSSSRLLTSSDVAGLSLQEINYAKNEVYARHGRLFKSSELQNYFNSKSWYHGTVSPDAFSEGLLSDVEKKNVEYLKDIEFGMAPNGYQLDVN